MEHTIQSQSVNTLNQDTLLFARFILNDVTQLVKGIRFMAAVLLRLAAMSESIATCLMACSESGAIAEA